MNDGSCVEVKLVLAKAVTFYVTEVFVVEAEGLGILLRISMPRRKIYCRKQPKKTIRKKGVRYHPTKAMEAKLNQLKFQKANLDVDYI